MEIERFKKQNLIIEGLNKLNEEDKWVTMNGTHVLVDGDGNIKDEKLRNKVKGSQGSETKKKIDDEIYKKELESKVDSRVPFRGKDFLSARTEEGKKIAQRNANYAKKGYLKDLDKVKLKKSPGRVTFCGDDGNGRRAELSISSTIKKVFKSNTGKALVTVLKSMGFESVGSGNDVWFKEYPEDDED